MVKPVHRNVLLAALLAAGLAAGPAAAAPPVWTIRDADSTIVLFGSIHVLKSGPGWEPPALSQALAKVDDLWFEIPLDEAGRLATTQAAVHLGLLPRGQTLRSLLGASRRAKARGSSVVLRNVGAEVARLLDITGTMSQFTIESNRD